MGRFRRLVEPGHELTFKIYIENPGAYAVHLRNIHHETDGDNDVWFALNDAPRWKVWDHHVNEFTWSEFDTETWQLDKGINTVHLIRRSRGFGIDRMVLHKVELDSTFWGGEEVYGGPDVTVTYGRLDEPLVEALLVNLFAARVADPGVS